MKNRKFSKNRGLFLAASLTTLTLAAIGCNPEDVASTDVRTHGMYANYDAIDSGNGEVVVRAELRVGGDDTGASYVRLIGDDELVSTIEEDEKVMQDEGSGDVVWYESLYGLADSSGLEVNIAFNRGEDDDSAPDSNVTMPPAFAVSIAEDEVQRGNDVTVTWDTEYSGRMFWEVDGDCIDRASGEIDDAGSLTLDAADVEVNSLDEGESCTATVTLERRHTGEIDPAFGDGAFIGTQRRAIDFTSTPADGEGEGGDGDANGGAGGSN
jgi:hypothetical protein